MRRRHVHAEVYRALTAGRRRSASGRRVLIGRSPIPLNSDRRPFITYILIESRATQFPICCVDGGRRDHLKPFSRRARRLCCAFYKTGSARRPRYVAWRPRPAQFLAIILDFDARVQMNWPNKHERLITLEPGTINQAPNRPHNIRRRAEPVL